MTHVLHHHLMHFHHSFFNKKTRVIIALTLRTFSAGLITVFIPLYLLESGYSLKMVALFFMAAYLLKIVAHYFIKLVIDSLGVNHMLSSSYIFSILFAVSLYFAQESVVWLAITVPLLALMKATYWDARHIELAEIFDKSKMVKQTSLLFILQAIVSVVGPLIGGFVSFYYSISLTLLIGMLAYVLAALVLVKDVLNERGVIPQVASAKPVKLIKKDLIANAAMNYSSVIGLFIWPLYIYYLDLDLSKVGLVLTIGLAVGLIVNWFFSTHALNHISIFIKFGLGFTSLFYFFAPNVSTLLGVAALGTLKTTGSALYASPYTSLFYRNARDFGPSAYITWIEAAGDTVKALLWLPVFIFAAYPLITFKLLFLTAALVAPIAILMTNTDDTSQI